MPEGIIATDDGDGFTTLDFVDKSLRGPALERLVEIGGPATIETITRRGPRRQYRVPTGNAVEAGLVDSTEAEDGEQARGILPGGAPSDGPATGGTGTVTQRVTSAGHDTGFATKLVAADPNAAHVGADGPGAGSAVDWHTPVAEYTSENAYVGQVPNDDVLHDRDQISLAGANGYGDSFGGLAHAPTHREVIEHVKGGSSVLAVGGVLPATEVEPRGLIPVSQVNLGLKEQTGALGTDPGARPDAGGEALASDYTTVQASRDGQNVKSADELGDTTVTRVAGTVQEPTNPTAVEGDGVQVGPTPEDTTPPAPNGTTPPDTEDVVEYPEGTPTKDWRRDELDAYALKVKGLDTSGLGNKAEVLAAINGE
ncbi:hypothetical protein SEA_FUNSIZED_19 [Mycobacterium phage Funsized]|nr:hypothetical protein SEA_FUNSIZED_19 [Mycobacterium phage Funsized]